MFPRLRQKQRPTVSEMQRTDRVEREEANRELLCFRMNSRADWRTLLVSRRSEGTSTVSGWERSSARSSSTRKAITPRRFFSARDLMEGGCVCMGGREEKRV